jgi:hypothetical protein
MTQLEGDDDRETTSLMSHEALIAEIKRLRERLITLETENASMSIKLSQQQWEVRSCNISQKLVWRYEPLDCRPSKRRYMNCFMLFSFAMMPTTFNISLPLACAYLYIQE